ncbi:meckelin [Phlebotomus argentipes]|uniref:meckelin n=1 Tax=Phlebotomus argentipes TaxID=94469 RepID=UPI0028933B5B|nr:meckelin [Phlebotomus argentipes]
MTLPIALMMITSLACLQSGASGEENSVHLFRSAESCKKDEFFDVNYLKCKKCESELNLVPSKSRLACECQPKELERIEYDNVLQQSICDRKCRKSANETCLDAPCGLRHVNQTNLSHQARHIQILGGSANCSCNYKHSSLYRNTFCIPNHLLKDYANYGHFRLGGVSEDLMFLTFFCHTLKRWRDCNHLANLCALSLYSLDRPSACFLFFATQTSDIASPSDMGERITPQLFHRRGRSTAEELDKILDHSFRLRGDTVNFTALQFSLDGRLRQFRSVNVLRELNLCPTSRREILFGRSFSISCQLAMEDVVRDGNHELIFTNLFVNYMEKRMPLIRSIPVLIRNSPGANSDNPETWQLVRRFFTVDLLTGLRAGYAPKMYEADKMQDKFDYIRCLTRVELRFSVKESNKLSTPLLILTYGEFNMSQRDSHPVDFHFAVTFARDFDFQYLLEILLPIFLLLAFVLAIFEAIAYKTRQHKLIYDLDVFCKFTVFLLSKVGSSLFAIVIIICLYIHFTFKGQTTVRLLLPLPVETLLRILTGVALALKSVKLAQHLWQIAHIDIFFIDWERPRIFEQRNQLDTPSVCSGSVTARLASPGESISAWRSYFVANEWQEITTSRKISMFIHTVALIWLLLLVQMENFASTNFLFHLWPSTDPPDGILLMSTGILAYTGVYIAQRLFNCVIWERYFKNPIQQFIDVCCVANVSVFILRLESYGYYIHGRSPHGFSDTDICSMILQFRQEERGQRGLTPGSELQTYSLLAPRNLRIFYDRLILPLQQPPQISEYITKGYEGTFERTILTYYSINRFFGAFIDHALKDLDYIVKEKTILEKLLNCEFEAILSENKGIFYVDNAHSFDEVLFYGSEQLFFQFELILFTFIVGISHNFLLAIILVGIVYKLLKFIMNLSTKHNLAKKTLIDKRFLM